MQYTTASKSRIELKPQADKPKHPLSELRMWALWCIDLSYILTKASFQHITMIREL